MCGIIGYVGNNKALEPILDGLRRMEYRGYDSSGITILEAGGKVVTHKTVGKIRNLEAVLADKDYAGTVGVGHQRWATHGGVTTLNAHPHASCDENIYVVHNGIIENYQDLKVELEAAGHTFCSETDTEVVAHLIEALALEHPDKTLEWHVRAAAGRLSGTYALLVVDRRHPQTLVAARFFSPLLIGIGDNEFFVASDASAILRYTRQVIYLDNGEIATITPTAYSIRMLDGTLVTKQTHHIEWSLEAAQKGGFDHFMLKEIFEQPVSLAAALRGRITGSVVHVPELEPLFGKLARTKRVDRVIIVACGTSYLSGQIARYMMEEQAGIPTTVEQASEFRYRSPVMRDGDLLIAISQSGETADTIAAIEIARTRGIPTLSIVNVVGSTIARLTDAVIYQHIGPEIGVASTKAFTAQTALLGLVALELGLRNGMPVDAIAQIAGEYANIPALIETILEQHEKIRLLAHTYAKYNNFLYLGRKYNAPVADEGALKLKEISYIHAEGYPAGEMKHGPIAMIDELFPSVIIAPRDSVYEKIVSNMEQLVARNGPVLAIATTGDTGILKLTKDVIYIPPTLEVLTPLLTVIPLQLFAYYIGVARGLDVDMPRNLAKSVTVE